MRVRYVYSACIVVETPDVRIAADPWFTQGIYDGSWFSYPPLPRDPLDVIGPVDLMYVSHIHPDHYDPAFLRTYVERFPETRLVIGDTDPPYLQRKMIVDGFAPEMHTDLDVGETRIRIEPCGGYEVYNIDTAMAIAHGALSVVNMNDNPYDEAQIERLLEICPGGRPTAAFLPYAGAGPYPQTYHFESLASRREAAEQRQERALEQFDRYVERLKPLRAVPFAGKYWLGGPLAALNAGRGVPDATVAAARHSDVACVLADGGEAVLDLATLEASAVRTRAYDEDAIAGHLAALWPGGYDYEREIRPIDGRPLPVVPLARAAYAHAIARGKAADPLYLCIRTGARAPALVMDLSGAGGFSVREAVEDLEPRTEISIDERYLFGLLTRLYHWNNADIGSQFRCRRVPDVFRREINGFLSHLHV